MNKKNIVIAGAGDRGTSLAKMLIAEGHNVTIIEQESEVAEKVSNLDALIIRGNVASMSTLEKAYIKNADFFIAITGNDEANIISSAFSKSQNCITLARINSSNYISKPISKIELKKVGVDVAFCPDLLTAKHMANIIATSNLINASPIARGRVVVVDASVKNKSIARGRILKDLKLPPHCNVVAIFHGDEVIIPHGDTRIHENDRLLILIEKSKEMDRILKSIHKLIGRPRQYPSEEKVSRVIIAGATRVGIHICKLLEEKDFTVALIEEDSEKCKKASEELNKTLIINGDYTDRELLLEEGIENTDVFLALTGREELNILISIMAKQYGAKHSIALVDRPGLKTILEDVGIDVIVSERWVTVDAIMRYIHMEDFESLSTLDQADTHMVEVKVKKGCPFSGKKLSKIKGFKAHDVIVAAINRDGKIVIPRGEDRIEEGDRIILFTKSSSLSWISRNFKGEEKRRALKIK